MKLRIPKRQPSAPGAEVLVHFCEILDRYIPILRTAFLAAGILAAALKAGSIADFLFSTGLLFQFAMWFDHWWITQRSR